MNLCSQKHLRRQQIVSFIGFGVHAKQIKDQSFGNAFNDDDDNAVYRKHIISKISIHQSMAQSKASEHAMSFWEVFIETEVQAPKQHTS